MPEADQVKGGRRPAQRTLDQANEDNRERGVRCPQVARTAWISKATAVLPAGRHYTIDILRQWCSVELCQPPALSMKPTALPVRHPVFIVESTEFERKAPSLLTPTERRGLLLLLADDPVRGEPVAGFAGLLSLAYAGCVVFYAVGPTLLKVYLLDIEKVNGDAPPPSREDAALLRKVLGFLCKAAIIVVVKRGVKWLWDYFRDGPPPNI